MAKVYTQKGAQDNTWNGSKKKLERPDSQRN